MCPAVQALKISYAPHSGTWCYGLQWLLQLRVERNFASYLMQLNYFLIRELFLSYMCLLYVSLSCN
jgi:hypothetical protein